ncbi:tRNA pseudouridine(55) synthase TruB [Candidatus Cardinium hertigii]|uniref:tRNA pseudouridine synthase B n=1 Tax=Candidatus Cardinium hertigii TaxID=247481 RepID=A0A2Z3LA42_9BACT|nr:tRNA pseudouridine(55) synthase TruB [Candidatus Cardinium hertigii]AWN82197.1 tRNA pseudouridine synthase B [Candidatus Cardinium hertigii]
MENALNNAIQTERGAILLIDKPLKWTSFDVVKKLRCALKVKKIGHAGTLDPLATGLLLICSGKQTKIISSLQELPKTYKGQIVLGKTTPSMDLETPFISETNCTHITKEMVYAAAASFVGTTMQTPPAYSACRLNGKRAYAMARQGQAVNLNARSVTIYSLELTAMRLPVISFELTCSKGTYVRSLAHDLGQKLGVGGYLHSLCRTQIGPYNLKHAFAIEEVC